MTRAQRSVALARGGIISVTTEIGTLDALEAQAVRAGGPARQGQPPGCPAAARSTAPGSRIPARYPGDDLAYGLHGSHSWAWDLVPMLLIGSIVAFGVWLIMAVRQLPKTSAV
jgi:hypothetical protein